MKAMALSTCLQFVVPKWSLFEGRQKGANVNHRLPSPDLSPNCRSARILHSYNLFTDIARHRDILFCKIGYKGHLPYLDTCAQRRLPSLAGSNPMTTVEGW